MDRFAMVIFPEMDTTAIERFRLRWDPLGGLVPAHITIAFPFEWAGPVGALVDAVEPVAAARPSFAVELVGSTVSADDYLFLLLGEGCEQVRRLHEAIYALELPGMALLGPFVPHLTVGRRAAEAELVEIPLPISGTARALTLYRLAADGSRRIERELPLTG